MQVLWLDPADAPKKAEDVDRFTCAEIPDPVTSPKLHALVQKNMVHGPCKGICPPGRGPPCLKNNQCDKDFPKDFSRYLYNSKGLKKQVFRYTIAENITTIAFFIFFIQKLFFTFPGTQYLARLQVLPTEGDHQQMEAIGSTPTVPTQSNITH